MKLKYIFNYTEIELFKNFCFEALKILDRTGGKFLFNRIIQASM